ncbi:MAG TPA: DUF3040 domain-containing protein [Segeticoccus sp.]|uniref:DUF3040 domain-containing protein n=1 Tax=Segeticoccus sp. TaxID=2706531 RepID=UPI002D80C9A7|nr:DUF3040 domain-containing protein [Segeticoccus sp.]HET8600603.1 DUF3040 domain-containing protein [Segeticoccus sp.]
MALTRKEEQTFRDLMSEACEGDPRFAARVNGDRWRRAKARRLLSSLGCFGIACLVLGLGTTVAAWVAGGVLFAAGAGIMLRPLVVGRLPSVSWKKCADTTTRPFRSVGGWVNSIPRHLPLPHRRAS